MKPAHIVILLIASIAIVSGTYWQMQDNLWGDLLKLIGISLMIVFIILFYKHLKSKNETTSK